MTLSVTIKELSRIPISSGFAYPLFVYTPSLGSRSRRCSNSCI